MSDMARAPSLFSESSFRDIEDLNRHSPRFRDKPMMDSSRSVGRMLTEAEAADIAKQKSRGLLSATFNLCSFCRQGGFVLECRDCRQFAGCLSRGSLLGCLPESALVDGKFTCPTCCHRSGSKIPYTIPSRAKATSHKGMNTSPTVMFSLYLEDTERMAVELIEALLKGYYLTKETDLLTLSVPFKDLYGKTEKRLIAQCQQSIVDFASSRQCRLVIMVQTHADPLSGGLSYGPQKTTYLDVILKQLLGPIAVNQFSNSMVFLNACGGFITKNPKALETAASLFGFKSLFSLNGRSVDPLLTSKILFYNIVDYHLIGNESVEKALKRSAQLDLLSNTSIVVWSFGTAIHLTQAPLRHEPNGVPVLCSSCSQPPSFHSLGPGEVAIFRCRQKSHDMTKSRKIVVKLLQNSRTREVVLGRGYNGCRYILERL